MCGPYLRQIHEVEAPLWLREAEHGDVLLLLQLEGLVHLGGEGAGHLDGGAEGDVEDGLGTAAGQAGLYLLGEEGGGGGGDGGLAQAGLGVGLHRDEAGGGPGL